MGYTVQDIIKLAKYHREYQMSIWLIVILVMVLGLTILVLTRTSKTKSIEAFQSTGAAAGSNSSTGSLASFLNTISGGATTLTSLQSASSTFTAGQENYGQNVLGKEVLTNAMLPSYSNSMNPAVNQPDIYLNTPENIIVRNLETDINSKFTDADIQWCKSAKMPSNLPPHVKGATVGCGWYYISNPNMTSSGALGQMNGPIYPNGPNNDGVNGIPHYGNGQWIWDLTIAEQLEEIKNCARIKSCIAIDAPSVNGVCGFCASSGVAIPANADGTEKYTKDITVNGITASAATCNTVLAMSSAECPKPPPAPYVSSGGINCGIYGHPSSDYSIRLYNQDECESILNGEWKTDGECLVTGGNGGADSSYSAVCAPLNGVKPAPPGPTICTPDINGKLSTACLASLAKAVGFNSQGSIIQALQSGGGGNLGEFDKIAIQIVTGQNVPVNPILYQGGVITVADAIASYDNIFSLIKGGSTPIVQQAAMWLCIGTNGFDPCNLPDDTPGPFIDQCVQQQWRIAGCQPAGSDYPSQKSTLDALNGLTWGKVKGMFQDVYNAMSNAGDPNQQDIAVMRCLGITTTRKTPPPCVGVSSDALILNFDSAAFSNADAKANYTKTGQWVSVNSLYTGNVVASGTLVCDDKGVQFDGTTVMGTPNIATTVKSLIPATPPPPILQTGFLPIGDVGMGVYSTEYHQPSPMFIINADRSGWQPIFQQLYSDIPNGVVYNATVKGNNSGIVYKFPVTVSSDGKQFYGVFGNPSVTKPDPILFIKDSALAITIQKDISAGSAGTPILPVKSGLVMWLDAADKSTVTTSGSSVSTWKDKSGSGHDMNLTGGGAGSVTYTAGSALNFQAGGILTTANNVSISAGTTVFVVCQFTAVTGAGLGYVFDFVDMHGPGDYSIRFMTPTTLAQWDQNDMGLALYYVNGNVTQYGHTVNVPGGFNTVCGVTGEGGTTRFSLSTTFMNRFFVGQISEVLVYNTKLSDADRQSVEGYLGCKWNIQSKLPSSSPFATVCPPVPQDASTDPTGETRELWINPNIDTCEILAIFTGPNYTQTYTAMALYKGQLMIALISNEKGYTFFSGGKVPVGQWSHIVHVYKEKGGINDVYINGSGPVSIAGLTRQNPGGYIGYSIGGGSKTNPLYQNTPVAKPFQGEIGAFRVYNRPFALTDVQGNLAATINTYVNQVQLATKNDPNALAMAAGQFYVPMLGNSINYQASPST